MRPILVPILFGLGIAFGYNFLALITLGNPDMNRIFAESIGFGLFAAIGICMSAKDPVQDGGEK